ncbi:hypothetical protein [Nevskia sp.]|uniref:DUF58 domain-containing protein n=1 Tax=Nevskia sp. TaxID=1929292 RepID=UPI0025EA4CE3|nr:hypothetical protein [Nevskia sp.]
MSQASDFYYRLPMRAGGQRPGSHPGTSHGNGQEFVTHAPLFSHPDPRRLDVRASIRDVRGEWLVRVMRQRVGVPVQLVADVSASMLFGARRSKLAVLADLARAIGASAFRVGDAAGMVAFDTVEREDLYVPASLSRGVGHVMAAQLENPALVEHAEAGERHRGDPVEGLLQALQRLAGRQCLVFLASDFHFPLARLDEALDTLSRAYIVPVILWDPAETEPPPANGLIALRDAETAARRTMWLRPKLREQWRDAVAERRASLQTFFSNRGLRPFWAQGAFDADAMSEYFFEANA